SRCSSVRLAVLTAVWPTTGNSWACATCAREATSRNLNKRAGCLVMGGQKKLLPSFSVPFVSMAAMKRRNGLWVAASLLAAATWVACTSGPSRKKNTGSTGGDEDTGGAVATGGARTGGSGPKTGGAGGSTGGAGGSTGGAGGAAGGAGGATTVLKMAWWGSPTRAERTNMVAKMFEAKNPGITIQTEFFATTQGMGIVGTDYWPTMNSYAMNDKLPDIMQHDYAYIEEWTGRNLVQPLDALIADGTIKLT